MLSLPPCCSYRFHCPSVALFNGPRMFHHSAAALRGRYLVCDRNFIGFQGSQVWPHLGKAVETWRRPVGKTVS
ncbi:MAG: hypothetical protein MI923_05450 [Phycisphaerales bacterium]|nr:hypothetical protein [Phycisphaerales bacterium]